MEGSGSQAHDKTTERFDYGESTVRKRIHEFAMQKSSTDAFLLLVPGSEQKKLQNSCVIGMANFSSSSWLSTAHVPL